MTSPQTSLYDQTGHLHHRFLLNRQGSKKRHSDTATKALPIAVARAPSLIDRNGAAVVPLLETLETKPFWQNEIEEIKVKAVKKRSILIFIFCLRYLITANLPMCSPIPGAST